MTIIQTFIYRDWTQIKVNKISLPQALRCWELQSSEHNHHDFDLIFNPVITSKVSGSQRYDKYYNGSDIFTESPVHKLFKISQVSYSSQSTHTNIPIVEKIRKKKRKRKHRRRHQHLNSTSRNKRTTKERLFNHERHRWLMHEDLCHHWALDSCSWPQCNRDCPKLHNPFTGNFLVYYLLNLIIFFL